MPPIYDHVEKRSQIEAGEVACGLLNLHWEQRSEAFLVWWPTGYVMKDSLAIDFTGGPGSHHMRLLFLRDFLVLSRCWFNEYQQKYQQICQGEDRSAGVQSPTVLWS